MKEKLGKIILLLAILVAGACWPMVAHANPAVNPPTNFTATDMGAISVNLTWAIGLGSTNTSVICKRVSAPTGRTDGEEVYFGNETSYKCTGLALETTEYYFQAWGHDMVEGYSATCAETSIGGEDMEAVATSIDALANYLWLIASIMFNLAIVGLAMWRREAFLYIIAIPAAAAFGWYWAGTYDMIAGIVFSAIGGYCIYLAVMRFIRG